MKKTIAILGTVLIVAACASGGSSGPGTNISAADITDAQTRLSSLGLYHDKIDGLWGSNTAAAVEQFQQQHNLPANGQLDLQTRVALQDSAPLAWTTR
jgi:N-acetylmuramoyl-L-alanine amidase